MRVAGTGPAMTTTPSCPAMTVEGVRAEVPTLSVRPDVEPGIHGFEAGTSAAMTRGRADGLQSSPRPQARTALAMCAGSGASTLIAGFLG